MSEENSVKVFNHGLVRLVDHMGGDVAVVQSARVSYGRGTKTPEEDRKLIAYLLKNHHGTPFEQAVFKFHIKCPIFVMRQWIRHRMSSYNEYSGRYSEMKDEFYIPEKWRAQDKNNKQGSVASELPHEELNNLLQASCSHAFAEYKKLLDAGAAKEMARMVLPINLYTEFYWTVNARALMHFIGLRSEAHAQWEIRQYSDVLFKFFSHEMPWTADAFIDGVSLDKYPGLFAKKETAGV